MHTMLENYLFSWAISAIQRYIEWKQGGDDGPAVYLEIGVNHMEFFVDVDGEDQGFADFSSSDDLYYHIIHWR